MRGMVVLSPFISPYPHIPISSFGEFQDTPAAQFMSP
jgi:hypothetical protein